MVIIGREKKFNNTTLTWFRKHGRDLPWRKTHDPYRILISEIMLQQTQVDRVLPKYNAFTKHFPSADALAHAKLSDVLAIWSGLGYNRRAKYLYRTAQIVSEQKKFPESRADLLLLPGIGACTASAIRAFAFGYDEPMIDTNIRRVLSRIFFKKYPATDQKLFSFGQTLIPKGKGREWNYAVMDIASRYCKARTHDADCPYSDLHGKVGVFVYKKPQKKFIGSDRYYRGQILRTLLASRKFHSIGRLAAICDLESDRVEVITRKLIKEGLLVEKNKKIALIT